MDINIEVVDANNITLVVTPTPTQTITIDRGIAGPQGPAGPAGGGVSSVSVVSANGLAGTVANPTTTPAITLSTTVTGIAKGDGTALSAAVANTDYITPPSGTSLLKAGSGGALANAVSGTDYAPATSGSSILYGNSAGGFNNVTVGSGLSFAAGTLAATGGSSGDVIGPASATDKAIVTFDGTTGKLIQNNSGNTIGTTGNTVISVTDNTNAALRITQLGTGNALLVEDDTNPDSTPFVIKQDGSVGIGTLNPAVLLNVSGTGSDPVFVDRYGDNAGAVNISTRKARGTVSVPTIVLSNDAIGRYQFRGYDGTQFLIAAQIDSFIDGTPGTNDMPGRLVFGTTADGASSPTERMRIDSAGNVGIGASTTAGQSVKVSKNLTGSTNPIAVLNNGAIQSDATAGSIMYRSGPSVVAAAFTLPSLIHYQAFQGTVGAGATVTSQFGFAANSTLTGATNNYGFYGDIDFAANRWNLYMNGTAANYLGGQLQLGQDYIEKTNVANTSTAITLDLANGTFQVLTLTGSPTITMPTAVAGKSFVILLKTGTGSFTVTWSTVKWPGGTAPTITSTASKQDIFSFFSDGTNWYGTTVGQNYTP